MKLFLMRHGDALGGDPDEIRPLSAQGVTEARAAGMFLKRSGEIPEMAYHSVLLRARQTAAAAVDELGGEIPLYECRGLRPNDSVPAFAAEFSTGIGKDILIVGHQPFISEFASFLLSGSLSSVSIQFTTGSLACLKRSGISGAWTLHFHITAKTISNLLDA